MVKLKDTTTEPVMPRVQLADAARLSKKLGLGFAPMFVAFPRTNDGLKWQLRELGRGQHSIVYEGVLALEDSATNTTSSATPVAVKVMSFNETSVRTMTHLAFQQEWDTLTDIGRHENVIQPIYKATIPPTFLDESAGEFIYITKCPKCEGKLETVADATRPTLKCDRDENHFFIFDDKNKNKYRDLFSDKRQPDDIFVVSFLHGEVIVFEKMTSSLNEFNVSLGTDQPEDRKVFCPLNGTENNERSIALQRLLIRLKVMLGAVGAIRWLHNLEPEGRIHGDVSAPNIMVGFEGLQRTDELLRTMQVKMIDFAFAKKEEERMKIEGIRPVYAPPELNLDPKAQGGRVTMYVPTEIAPKRANAYASDRLPANRVLVCDESGSTLKYEVGDYIIIKTSYGDLGEFRLVQSLEPERALEIIKSAPAGQKTSLSGIKRNGFFLAEPLSPESIKNSQRDRLEGMEVSLWAHAGYSSDIYSLGCVLGWMITEDGSYVQHILQRNAGSIEYEEGPLDVTRSGGDNPYLSKIWEYLLERSPLVPLVEQDSVILSELFKIMVKCLVRKLGGYCESRIDKNSKAADNLYEDILRVYNAVYFRVFCQIDEKTLMGELKLANRHARDTIAELQEKNSELKQSGWRYYTSWKTRGGIPILPLFLVGGFGALIMSFILGVYSR